MTRQTRPPLTKKRQSWAAGRNGIFRGNPLNVNHSAIERYQSRLERMIEEMTKEVERELKEAFKRPAAQKIFAQDDVFTTSVTTLLEKLKNKFSDWFDEQSEPLSSDMASSVEKTSKSSLHSALEAATGGLSLKTGILGKKTKEAIAASVSQNVGLIKSIPTDYFGKIKGVIMRSIQNGGGATSDLFDEIQQFGVVTKDRAAFIARDQTSKATTAVNSARMKDLNIRRFEWLHSSGGKHPRPLHQKYDGQIFDLDDPPIIDERTGEKGLPGQLPNCRCRMVPVICYGNGNDDETQG